MKVICSDCEMFGSKSDLDPSSNAYFCDQCGKGNWPSDEWPGWLRLGASNESISEQEA